MKFISVEINNFLSIKNVTLDLSKPGLYLVNGKNNDDPSFSSNGSGKTSLFDAVTFCLFGRTTKDLTLDQLVQEGEKHAEVILQLLDDEGNKVSISRSKTLGKPVNLKVYNTITGEDLFIAYSVASLQSNLEDWLGIDYLTFCNSVFFGKGLARFFVALDDNERKAILDSVLRTVSFDKALETSKELLASTNKSLNELENNLKLNTSLLEIRNIDYTEKNKELKKVNSFLSDLKEVKLLELKKLRLEKQNIIEKLRSIDEELRELKEESETSKEVQKLKKEQEKFVNDIKKKNLELQNKEISEIEKESSKLKSEYDNEVNDTTNSIKTLTSLKADAEKEIKSFKEKETILKVKISSLESSIKEVTSFRNLRSCPTCKQKINHEDSLGLLSKYEEELEKHKQELSDTILESTKYKKETLDIIEQNLTQLKEFVDHAKSTYLEKKLALTSGIEQIKNNYFKIILEETTSANNFYKEKIELLISTLSTKVIQLENEKRVYSPQLSSLSDKENAISSELVYAEEGVTSLSTEVNKLQKEISLLETKILKDADSKEILDNKKQMLEFWVEGFGNKGIKSFILETSFPYLTERANFYSSFLTGGSVVISISPTATAKTTGNTKEKIVISATNSYGSDVYQGQSDGERRRIDLCILLALKDLIALRAKRSYSLMVLDEIGDSLDASGIERMINVFREVSKDKTIFVISHNDQLKNYFDQTVTIVKNKGVSSLV